MRPLHGSRMRSGAVPRCAGAVCREPAHRCSWRPQACLLAAWAFVWHNVSAVAAGPSAGGEAGRRERLSGLFRRRCERGFTQPVELTVALEHETAAVERGERRAVADRHDRGAPEPRVEKAVKRGFRRLVERSSGFVEEKIIGRMKKGTGNATAF